MKFQLTFKRRTLVFIKKNLEKYGVIFLCLCLFLTMQTLSATIAKVATGAGHHSVLQSRAGNWYIVYHRRPLGETDRNHRVVSIDEMRFDERGFIQPVRITKEGVAADPIRR
jgi:hypothetical protein